MNLQEKVRYVKVHLESVLRHDDEPLEVRQAAAGEIQAHLQAELTAAEERETDELAEKRKLERQLLEARDRLETLKRQKGRTP